MILQEKVQTLPSSPGVYLMKDSVGGVIYVGKAKNLKRRVQSYFRDSKGHSPKIKKLVKHLKDFDYILTDTEFEAFLLECHLIKEIKPIYNRKMKNPGSFVYIKIHQTKRSPKIEITNWFMEDDDHFYFGPYTSRSTVEKAIQGIKECFQLLCSNPANSGSACLNYSLGLCNGICLGGSAVEEYNRIIEKVISLLNGTDMGLINEMQQKMHNASLHFDFESAAKYRDHIDAVAFLLKKEKVIEFTEQNKNIAIIESLTPSTIKLFLIKRTEILFTEKYVLNDFQLGDLRSIIKEKILMYFKMKDRTFVEVDRNEIDEAQIIYSYLTSKHCNYFVIQDNCLENENNAKLGEEITQLLEIQYTKKHSG
ncbi:GIY-YIG nuclease family protein [Bacillus sp. CGMCC 1.16607]|uniref:GIY-YIG nuclease family protein n=1 Tax=Bacillus sp. CGMCC 1.16607 TaxID=3351842 RepID=UPI003624CE3F